ncbi:MAG: pyridoxal kinase PdxY [Pseudonocardiales bacterium]|nr:pyridoxal kinase PdxY [Pseudonocardiales bacterium]
MQILSVQSSVAYGHVGNSAAVFPLQRLGHEVWPVLTVHFSNHTGYGEWRGPLLAPSDVADVIRGVGERGVFPTCDAVLSGYQGAETVGEVVLDAVAQVKAANPAAVYCCDPVMGDVGRGFFVRPGIPEFMRDRVVPAADVVTPNQFELEFLVGSPVGTVPDLLAAVDAVRATGPRRVLVTSVRTDATPDDAIEMVAVDDEGAWSVRTPLLPLSVNGAGDLTAALFLAHSLTDGTRVALERTASSVFAVLAATHEAGRREIALVPAQDEIVAPTRTFTATALR